MAMSSISAAMTGRMPEEHRDVREIGGEIERLPFRIGLSDEGDGLFLQQVAVPGGLGIARMGITFPLNIVLGIPVYWWIITKFV